MIEKLLDQSALKNGYQVSFILNQRVLTKAGRDWVEVKGEALSIEEWEDLKDLCLQGNEKVQLETKGFIAGVMNSDKHQWKYSFIEKKDCFRAHLSLLKPREEAQSFVENPLFWEAVKKEGGLFIIAGERRQGKSALLNEIIMGEQTSHLSLVGIHSSVQSQDLIDADSIVQLGAETLETDSNHVLYEGIEKVAVDMNAVKSWKKWIEMAEQGQTVLMTLSLNSVKTLFNKLLADLDVNTCLRFMAVLNGVIVQKLIGPGRYPCHEILVIKEKQKTLLKDNLLNQTFSKMDLAADFKDSYTSLNQSLIQRLIRRKIDVQAAFEASDDPEQLDVILKKMGL